MLTGVAIVASLVVATPGIAQAAWTAAATSTGYAKAVSVPQGNPPTTSVNGRDVTVSWAVARFPNTTPVAGYTVRRFNASTGVPQTVLASCTGTIAALTCTEFGVAPGTWKYAVTPKQALWTGPESVQSATATVGSPSLTLTTTTMSTLPVTSGGSIANFLDGETVTYHLDSAGGAVLAGSITPSPVPVGGSATVSVTIPAGTLLGAHSVFAVGSLGSTASAAFTVIDNTAPVVSAAVINKTLGDRPGFVKQGGTYFVYANANDTAGTTGTHIVSTVTANVTNITTGSTAVALTTAGGPWTVGGVSYTYRSASMTATNPIAAGPKSFTVTATDVAGNTSAAFTGSVTVDNTVPTATTVQTTNAGTISRIEAGDTITYTYGEAIDPNSILTLWTGASIAVTVRLNNNATDTITVFDSLNTTQVNVGSVNLARTDYTSFSRTIPSTMVMSGSTITITFGTPSGATTTAGGTATMVWSPSILATDLAGNACTATNANENGTLDRDF
jgi:hypothetical protein